jgi:deazaflavin-dependent oxidoreductase (nitroreductase family)
MPAIPEVFFKVMNGTHRVVLTVSGGRIGRRFGGMQVVELTTVGRRSGERRTVLLTAPVIDGDDVVIVASKGGNPGHPAWYLNLRANPEVTVRLDGVERTMTARTVSAEEKAALWPRITQAYRGYQGYQDKTDRAIPVVILSPV